MTFLHSILSLIGSAVLQIIASTGYAGVFFLMALESAALPIPSEIIMPFSGFLAGRGTFGFWSVVFIGALGNLIGSMLLYWVGKSGGRTFVKRWGRFVFFEEHYLVKAEEWFARYGASTIFFGRLLPVIRTYISFPAGLGRMNFWKFSIYTLAGSLPWSWVLAYVGFSLGERWDVLEPSFRKLDIVILLLILLLGAWCVSTYFRNGKGYNGKNNAGSVL